MNIYEAAKLATEKGMYITQEQFRGMIKIRPTNNGECCIIMKSDGSDPRRGWQPTADDLVSTSWTVTE